MKKIIIPILLFFVLTLGVQRLLIPKYMSEVYEGALIGEYYDAPKNNDVLFIGACDVYENYSPVTLYREFGIASYIRGGPQQLIWQSKAMLEDALRYETPQYVVFDVCSVKYGAPQSEPYNRLNLDELAFSSVKLRAVQDSALKGESVLSYFVPLLRYHERWRDITTDDFLYFFNTKQVGFNGYFMRSEVKAVDIIPKAPALTDYTLSETAMTTLGDITSICKENGISLILVKSPTIWPAWYDQWDEQIADYAGAQGLLYYNLTDMAYETGVDFTTDTADGGLHMNVYGAEKLARWLGGVIRQNGDSDDHRGDKTYDAYWNGLASKYDWIKELQAREIEESGKVLTHTF
jgi:hypothetical protein